jgi:DNA-binding GntR family transcriptional regulator
MREDPLGSIAKMDTTPVHERIYQELRSSIMRGKFAPGAPLTIRELAEAFGTSPMPVRDALGRLVVERALEMPSTRAFRVPFMTHAQFLELCEFRLVVEGYAVELAARQIEDPEIAEIEGLDRVIASAVKVKDEGTLLRCNVQLMFAVYAATRRPLIVAHIESLWLQLGPYMIVRAKRVLDLNEPIRGGSIGHHAELMDALKARDSDRAREAVRSDIRETMFTFLLPADFARSGD